MKENEELCIIRREIDLECEGKLSVLTRGRGEFLSDSPFHATEDTKRLLTLKCSLLLMQHTTVWSHFMQGCVPEDLT
jgi:hypothetical protein